MWEIDNIVQSLNFLRGIILGLFISHLFVFIKACCFVFKRNKKSFLAEDLIFVFILTPVLFIFMISTSNGQPRGYIFISLIIGIVSYNYILSEIIFKISVFLLNKLKQIFLLFFKITEKINHFILNAFKKLFLKFKFNFKSKKSLEKTGVNVV